MASAFEYMIDVDRRTEALAQARGLDADLARALVTQAELAIWKCAAGEDPVDLVGQLLQRLTPGASWPAEDKPDVVSQLRRLVMENEATQWQEYERKLARVNWARGQWRGTAVLKIMGGQVNSISELADAVGVSRPTLHKDRLIMKLWKDSLKVSKREVRRGTKQDGRVEAIDEE